jgi:SulP family sulfate permease
MRRLARVQPFDFWVAIAAILGTLAFGVLAGVMIGIGLSLLWLIWVATHPSIATLARQAGTQVFRDVSEYPGDERIPGVVVIRMDGGLFFATSDALEDRIREIIHTAPDLTGVVLDCAGINFIESQGCAKMDDIVTLASDSGITLRMARLKKAVRATLERDGVLERIGAGNIHGNVDRAVRAQLEASAPPPGEGRSTGD